MKEQQEFFITIIESLTDENEELKRNFEDWNKYHNDIINYLNKIILDLDNENAILRKEISKYEN